MKRHRPVNSCLPCRKRRLKCDKEHPSCGRCLSTNQDCVYDETASSPTSRDSNKTSAFGQPPRGYTDPSASRRGSQKASNHDDQGRLIYASAGRAFYNGATFWGNAIPPEDIENNAEELNFTGNTRSSTPVDENSLSWTHGPFRPPPNSRLKLPAATQSHCYLCGRGYRIACVQAMLPSQEVCTKLCSIFFSTIFPLVPILHLQGLRQDLDELWKAFGRPKSCQQGNMPLIIRRKPGLLCLLSSILFSALYCTPSADLDRVLGPERPKSLLNTSYLATMVSATLTGFPRRPSLYTLAAYIFVQSQFVREEEFHIAPEFISLSFRLSISMGLHRELPNANFGEAELETRKRLWWYIIHLDVMASASSGLSPIFADEKMSNVSMIKDFEDLTTPDGSQAKKRDVRYVIATKRYEATKEIRNILRLHFEDAYEIASCCDETTARLGRLAKQIGRSCTSLLDLCASYPLPNVKNGEQDQQNLDFSRTWSIQPGKGCEMDTINFAHWGVILLHMMVHKAYCTFYHPLVSQEISGDFDSDFRVNAVKHSQAFLHLFIQLCNGPNSEPYHWMYPGTYQPLQAVSLLVADLLHRPHSDEAETSRGLIDRVFEMYSVEHGMTGHNESVRRDLSPVGRSAWKILVRARRKALELMGEDAHLLIPSHPAGVSPDKCICGETIAWSSEQATPQSNLGPKPNQREEEEAEAGDQLASTLMTAEEPEDEAQPQVDGIPTLWSSTDDFDWQEFGALAGISSGFMS